jgi:hypothetical protein
VSEIDQTPIEQSPEAVQLQPTDGRVELFPAWSAVDFILLTIAIVVCVFFVQGTGVILAMLAGYKVDQITQNTKLMVSVQVLSYLAVLGIMWRMVRYRSTNVLQAIRWNWPGQNAILYPAIGVALAVGIAFATKLLDRFIPSNLPIEKMFRTQSDAWFLVFFGLTLAPLLEELYFRGFLYPTLRRYAGGAIAITVTVLLFTAIHAPQIASSWVPLLMLTIASLCFTVIRLKADSVSAALLTHIGYNGTLFLTLFLATDGFRNLEKLAK